MNNLSSINNLNSPLPCNVTQSPVLGIKTWPSRGPSFCLPQKGGLLRSRAHTSCTSSCEQRDPPVLFQFSNTVSRPAPCNAPRIDQWLPGVCSGEEQRGIPRRQKDAEGAVIFMLINFITMIESQSHTYVNI